MLDTTTDQHLCRRLQKLHDDLVKTFPRAQSDHMILRQAIKRIEKLQELEQPKPAPDEDVSTRLKTLADDVADTLRAAAGRIEELEAAADSHTCYLNE